MNARCRRRVVIGHVLLAFGAMSPLTCGQETRPKCEVDRSFSAQEYWFHEVDSGVGGLEVVDSERRGYLLDSPWYCFRIPLRELDSPKDRVLGYETAIESLARRVNRDTLGDLTSPRPDAPPAVRHLDPYLSWQNVKKLLGRDFKTLTEFWKWWQENRDYLTWSEQAGHLVVDEAAKASGASELRVNDRLPPQDFWFWKSAGLLQVTSEHDGVVEGTYNRGKDRFRIAAAELADRAAKEQGFIRAVDYLVKGIELDPKGAADQGYGERLKALTGLELRRLSSWPAWWKKNRDRVRLADDGTHLVVAGTRRR